MTLLTTKERVNRLYKVTYRDFDNNPHMERFDICMDEELYDYVDTYSNVNIKEAFIPINNGLSVGANIGAECVYKDFKEAYEDDFFETVEIVLLLQGLSREVEYHYYIDEELDTDLLFSKIGSGLRKHQIIQLFNEGLKEILDTGYDYVITWSAILRDIVIDEVTGNIKE